MKIQFEDKEFKKLSRCGMSSADAVEKLCELELEKNKVIRLQQAGSVTDFLEHITNNIKLVDQYLYAIQFNYITT